MLIFTTSFAQDSLATNKEKNGLRDEWNARFFMFHPMQFGDHALAEAHSATIGLGANLGLLSYGNFNLYAGWDYVQYKVTDKTMVGNITNSNYHALYGAVKYKFAASKQWEFYPDLGYGYAIIKQRSGRTKFGHQDGAELRLGFTANFKVSSNTSFFIGTHYIHNEFEIKTNGQYEKFFGQANQLQISAGIQLD